jgi:hypothetical protein
MTQSRFAHLLAGLASDAEIIPHQLDLLSDRVLLTRIPLAAQAAASFLDQRALAPNTEGAWFSWTEFASGAHKLPVSAPAYILHVGHCGSTLMSRLVETATGRPALREPLPLRTLATDAADALSGAGFLSGEERRRRLALLERVLARRGAVVKTTSICNDLAPDFSAQAHIAFVYIKPEVFLAAMLGGPNSQTDLRGFAQMRVRRLKSRLPELQPLPTLSGGEVAALCWLTETSAIVAAKRDVLAIDFDQFLGAKEEVLARLCAHLGAAVDAAAVKSALAGGVMDRYAKATEHAYNAETRAAGLVEARSVFATEIRAGLAWLERTAKQFPEGGAALSKFG